MARHSPPAGEHPTFADVLNKTFEKAAVGAVFGPSWSTHWLKVTVAVPTAVREKHGDDVLFEFDADAEALVWTLDGRPVQGLTGGDGERRRTEFPLSVVGHKRDSEAAVSFYVELACNGLFGVGAGGMINPPDLNRTFTLKTADIVVPNLVVRGLIHDLQLIEGMAKNLPEASERAQQAIYAGNDIINNCWPTEPASLQHAANLARQFLTQHPASTSDHLLHFVGHCHIDTAWLWTYRETRRKAARSWASQLRLMEKFPDYKFACSQAQQLEWVQQDYPSLFAELQQKTKTGQFVPIGGTWIEMDCNIPNGESLVRQFLYGQRYFAEHFGQRCSVFWLPDTFGYAAQLPQIMNSVGCKYFMSQKMSWNLINAFPLTSFHWQGLNGEKVLAHFPPADTYNGQADVKQALFAVSNNKDRDRTSHSMQLIGIGDGGGGPQLPMLERVERMKNTAGLPRMTFSSPTKFFDELSKSPNLLTWSGELYLELHRGTYTTQAFIKKDNRRIERVMHDLELLSTMAHLHNNAFKYPRAQLLQMWKSMLLQQFHDVIPGTSIGPVYDDVRRAYSQLDSSAQVLETLAVQAVAEATGLSGLLVYNGLSWARNGLVSIPEGIAAQLRPVSSQRDRAREGHVLVQVSAESLSLSRLTLAPNAGATSLQVTIQNGHALLENEFVHALLSPGGRLIEWRLRTPTGDWTILPTNAHANVFALYEDIPLYWDAWDVELYHREKRPMFNEVMESAVRIVESGPLRVAVEFTLSIGNGCKICQTASLTRGSPLLTFETSVDWNESRRILKVEFPMDIVSDHAVYETQFGLVERPTHTNTSWEAAKFEVCGHRFAALCEANFGVALLTDSKYGYSALPGGRGLALSLLRAPKAPDDRADIGHHSFSYGLLPFTGTLQQAEIVRRAAEFNAPLRVVSTEPTATGTVDRVSLGSVSPSSVIIDTVKLADDSKRVIVRAYECDGGRAHAEVKWNGDIRDVRKCNMLEDLDSTPCTTTNGAIPLSLRRFEIVTLSIE